MGSDRILFLAMGIFVVGAQAILAPEKKWMPKYVAHPVREFALLIS
ncbi:MAG: hypothetical protein Ct9H300mP23_04930 [Nitrospinota bacterium]|nr:MAG: hypothetical protein Ct9H300mP23_04930 [Nitrospinota bacterium]